MTLVVEDGTGLANAESYVSVSEIDDYANRFGKTFTGTLTDKEVRARQATQFLDNKYPFSVNAKTSTQALLFPAEELILRGHSVTGIPRQLKDACCELAIIAATTSLTESVTARAYTYRKVKVGDVEKTERFETENTQNVFHTVELILRPLLAAEIGEGVRTLKMVRT